MERLIEAAERLCWRLDAPDYLRSALRAVEATELGPLSDAGREVLDDGS